MMYGSTTKEEILPNQRAVRTDDDGYIELAPATIAAIGGATAKTLDYDTGAGTDTVEVFGVALPGAGGAVAGGTATNPLRTDPTGTTAQPITDNGGSLTVDGTVDIGASALPTGAATETTLAAVLAKIIEAPATSAKQDTQTTALQAIQASVETIDNAIAGTEMQVDIIASLPAGTNAIGKLAANSGVDIGDVDVLTLPSMSRIGSISITRPSDTTAYTAGDAIGDTNGSAIISFDNFGTAGEQIIINTIEFKVNVASVPSGMGTFRLHFYSSSPTAIADNAAWDLPAADRGIYMGNVQLVTPTDLGSTIWSQNDNLGRPVVLTGTNLYAILVTENAFTPVSAAVKTIKLRGFRV